MCPPPSALWLARALLEFLLLRLAAFRLRRFVLGVDHRARLGVDVDLLDPRAARNLELVRVDQSAVLMLELDRLNSRVGNLRDCGARAAPKASSAVATGRTELLY
jgi:hypothetical protein